MKNKEFKLLVENFNKFLLNEHIGHSQDDIRLFDAIPDEFKDYINDTIEWYNGESWMAETDHGGDQDAEDDEKLLFEEVAKACGCNVKDLLVTHEDPFADSLADTSQSGGAFRTSYYSSGGTGLVSADDFLRSYKSNGTLCGSFEMNGTSLKGFYFSNGINSAQLGLQFNGSMSERTLKGLIFVAPYPPYKSSNKSARKFKSSLGGAWG